MTENVDYFTCTCFTKIHPELHLTLFILLFLINNHYLIEYLTTVPKNKITYLDGDLGILSFLDPKF